MIDSDEHNKTLETSINSSDYIKTEHLPTIMNLSDQSRESQYKQNYQVAFTNIEEPDISNCLADSICSIEERATVVDHVAGKLSSLPLLETSARLSKAVAVMDYFLKYGNLGDRKVDIKLIGIGALSLTLKYEGHINDKNDDDDIILHALEGSAYTKAELCDMELMIAEKLGFNLRFPSRYDLMATFIFENFNGPSEIYNQVSEICAWILNWCSADATFNNISTVELVTCIAQIAIELNCERLEKVSNKGIESSLSTYKDFIEEYAKEPFREVLITGDRDKAIVDTVKNYIETFGKKFGCCKNLISLDGYVNK